MSGDIKKLQDVATQFSDIIKKETVYAKKAHTFVRLGKVVDASLAFKAPSEFG